MDELLADLAALGWLFNNCYQYDDGTFRVNLRRPDANGSWLTDFATGPTLFDALSDCMSKLHDAEFSIPTTSEAFVEARPKSLLDQLNLRPNQPPIIRRF